MFENQLCTCSLKELPYSRNLAKGRFFTQFWRTKMNAERNMWAASAETPKLYLPKQSFCSFAKILSLQFYLLYSIAHAAVVYIGILLFLQRKYYTSVTVDVFVFLHTYVAFNFLYVVMPVAIVCLVVVIIILTIVSRLIYIKQRTRRSNAQHVYDCVNHHPSPPQPPPPRIATHNNPAYVKVELTECVAYTSTHDPGSPNYY